MAVRLGGDGFHRVRDAGNVAAAVRHRLGVEGLIRVCSFGALASSVAFALVALGMYAVERDGSGRLAVAVGAVSLALALHVRHLRYALAGRRAPAAGWTLGVLAVVIIGPTQFLGLLFWVPMFHVVAASAFFVLRPRWAIAAYFSMAVLATLWTFAVDWPIAQPVVGFAVWHGLHVLIRGLAPVVLVWLVLALRNVEAMRHAVAREAVEMERRRIADEFHRTVGEALERLVGLGGRAAALVATDPERAEGELERLVGASRRTLADARQLLRRPSPTARAELEATVTILRAAGVDVTVELEGAALPLALEEPARRTLREFTTELVRTGAHGRIVVTLVADSGSQRLDCHTELPAPVLEPNA